MTKVEIKINLNLNLTVTNTTAYKAVFGITAHCENHQSIDEYIKCQGEATELASGKNTFDNDQREIVERAGKPQKIREEESQYNEEIVKQTRQPRKALVKIDDMVEIKLNRQGRQNESCTPEHAVGKNNGDQGSCGD